VVLCDVCGFYVAASCNPDGHLFGKPGKVRQMSTVMDVLEQLSGHEQWHNAIEAFSQMLDV